MKTYSTREAAKKLGLSHVALLNYIAAKKIPTPDTVRIGRFRLHKWTASDVEKVRKILPKIANGRKTRYKKKGPKKKK